VLSGAFSGATLGLRLTEWLVGIGVPHGVADAFGVGSVVAVISYTSLIVGELVPKRIALRDPEQIAVSVAPAMTILAHIASPLVWLLHVLGNGVLRSLGYRCEAKERVTDEEIRILIADAESAGVIEPGERAMIAGVMRLGDRPVRAIMTPRRDVDMVDLSDDPETIRRTIAESTHSRLPVIEGATDDVLGVAQAKEILDVYLRGGAADIRCHVRQAPVILDTADALDVVDLMKRSPIHIALVHDEYGHFEGIVTNADLLESIVGALKKDEGPIEPDAVQRDDGSWLVSGRMPADEMGQRLSIAIPERRSYHTAAGFVLENVGHLPTIGETFETQNWRFEIVDLDGHRIDKILALRVPNGHRRVAVR
jgi:magnesium and cobalt exporter, CNNM family